MASSSSRRASARTSQRTSSRPARRTGRAAGHMVFTERNYILLGIALVLIIVGYSIMRIENEVDGFLSLYIAPLLILGGYLEAIYAILWRAPEVENTA